MTANQNSALEDMADKVCKLGWESAVVFFLEAHKPFTTIFHTASLVFEPLAAPLFGAERFNHLQTLLADRKNIEQLIELIEAKSIAKRQVN